MLGVLAPYRYMFTPISASIRRSAFLLALCPLSSRLRSRPLQPPLHSYTTTRLTSSPLRFCLAPKVNDVHFFFLFPMTQSNLKWWSRFLTSEVMVIAGRFQSCAGVCVRPTFLACSHRRGRDGHGCSLVRLLEHKSRRLGKGGREEGKVAGESLVADHPSWR